jgi:hypothetical protein
MKILPYSLGVVVSLVVLYFAFTADAASKATIHAGAIATSYLVYSTLAFVLTRFGKQRQAKAWLFFGSGVVLLFAYLPSLEFILGWFYYPRTGPDRDWSEAMRQLYFYAPLIVSALCIFRAISFWADESVEKKEPNQSPQRNADNRPFCG